MKIKTKLLFIGATIALAMPMFFMSNAAAAAPEVDISYNGTNYSFGPPHDDEFLNSPHARNDGVEYHTAFMTSPDCTGCHGEANPTTNNSTITTTCTDCHDAVEAAANGAPANIGYAGFHDGIGGFAPDSESSEGITAANPRGRGTNPDACVACHMGTAKIHLFRINTDGTYSPFPDSIGATTAVPAEEIYGDNQTQTFAEAVWLSVTEACLQCHGEEGGATTYMTKNEAAFFAYNYHNIVQGIGSCSDPQYVTEAACILNNEVWTPGNQAVTSEVPNVSARFNWYPAEECYQVYVDGAMNKRDCDWSTSKNKDGSEPVITEKTTDGCIATIQYKEAGHYEVTLTTSNNGTPEHKRSMVVNAVGNNEVPQTAMDYFYHTSGNDQWADPTGMTVVVKDDSTSNSCDADNTSGTAIVLWGDGVITLEPIRIGTVVGTHTYKVPGTYTLRYSFRDSDGNKAIADQEVITVPAVEETTFTAKGFITDCLDINNDGDCLDQDLCIPTNDYNSDGDCDDSIMNADGTFRQEKKLDENGGLENVTIKLYNDKGTLVKIGKTADGTKGSTKGAYEIRNLPSLGMENGEVREYRVVPSKVGYDFEADFGTCSDNTFNNNRSGCLGAGHTWTPDDKVSYNDPTDATDTANVADFTAE